MKTTYAVSGSREFSNLALVEKVLRKLAGSSTIIFGDAAGVDAAARTFCEKMYLKHKVYKADWSLGKWAGPKRNSELVEDCDKLIAFWNGSSTGTKDAIDKARKAHKPLLIIYENGEIRREECEPPPVQVTLW